MKKTPTLPAQTRDAPVASFNEAERTLEVVWTTGAGFRRFDPVHGRAFDETLSLDPAHVRMARLQSGRAPVLDEHRAAGTASALGVVLNATLEAGRGIATIKLSQRATGLMDDVRDGIVRNVSVGYWVHRYAMTPPRDGSDVWQYRAVDWEPIEISFVLVPADASAHARAAGAAVPCEFIDSAASSATTQERNMMRSFVAPLGIKVEKDADDAAVRSAVIAHLGLADESTDDEIVAAAFVRKATPAPSAGNAAPDEIAQVRSAAEIAERKRNAEIITLCARHAAPADFQSRAIEQGWSMERTGLELLNERHARGVNVGPTNTANAGTTQTRSASVWDQISDKGGK